VTICRACEVCWLDATHCWSCGRPGSTWERGVYIDTAILYLANWARPRVPEDGLDFLTMAVA